MLNLGLDWRFLLSIIWNKNLPTKTSLSKVENVEIERKIPSDSMNKDAINR